MAKSQKIRNIPVITAKELMDKYNVTDSKVRKIKDTIAKTGHDWGYKSEEDGKWYFYEYINFGHMLNRIERGDFK